jgi:hypothetical protein
MDSYASGSARSSVEVEIGGPATRGGLLSGREYPPNWANRRQPGPLDETCQQARSDAARLMVEQTAQ